MIFPHGEVPNALVRLAAGVGAGLRAAHSAALGVRLPLLTGGPCQFLRSGGRRPAPRGPRLQPQHLPHGGNAVPPARHVRLPDLPRPPAEGPDRAAGRPGRAARRPRRPVMFTPITRRGFVANTLKAGAVAGLGDFAFLKGLPAGAADAAKVTPRTVQYSSE